MEARISKWIASHARFRNTISAFLEHSEEGQKIPQKIFLAFLKSVICHSRGEEKMFQGIPELQILFAEHKGLVGFVPGSEEEKVEFCKHLLVHMQEEETAVRRHFKIVSTQESQLKNNRIL